MKFGVVLMITVLAVAILWFKTSIVVQKLPITTLKLERVEDSDDMNKVKEKDNRRMQRVSKKQQLPQVGGFPVFGGYEAYGDGLYYAMIQLGTPSKNYYVKIDTGTDAFCVDCRPCSDCYKSNTINDVYSPSRSSTSHVISCSEGPCSQPVQSSDTNCSSNQCSYTFRNVMGSVKSSGYYVSDIIQVTTLGVGSRLSKTSANVVFGCSTYITPESSKSEIVLDGVFGFGHQGFSIMSQLFSQGVTPNAFLHCLSRSSNGGGSLIIGHTLESDVIYTPLAKSQSGYHVNLESISVRGHQLSIDPETFAISDNRGGTIIDSGTSLVYLPKDAHISFVDAITQSISKSTQPFLTQGNTCYIVTTSVSKSFPNVSLNFVGGATMQLRPQDYLVRESEGGAEVWCLGFQKSPNSRMTVLGDIVLKDKIIVYDLDAQQIGWLDYDCSTDITVTNTSCGGRSKVDLFFMMFTIFLSIYFHFT